MKNKKMSLTIVVLLLVVGVTAGYVASTYAKYTSDLGTKNGTATVAKWAFTSENQSKTLQINLDETYDENTLVANRIAPGTAGSFSITLSNEQSEVGVDYVLDIGTATNVPTNLKFYSDNTYTTEITNTKRVTGTLAPGATGENVTIYWKWEYETTNGDAADNTAGTNAASGNAAMTVPITITGTQAQPTQATSQP